MSYFGFKRNDSGEIVVSDQDAAEALELLINQLILLNLRFEEAFDTGLNLKDIDDGRD